MSMKLYFFTAESDGDSILVKSDISNQQWAYVFRQENIDAKNAFINAIKKLSENPYITYGESFSLRYALRNNKGNIDAIDKIYECNQAGFIIAACQIAGIKIPIMNTTPHELGLQLHHHGFFTRLGKDIDIATDIILQEGDILIKDDCAAVVINEPNSVIISKIEDESAPVISRRSYNRKTRKIIPAVVNNKSDFIEKNINSLE